MIVEMNKCLATRRWGDRFKPHEHELYVVVVATRINELRVSHLGVDARVSGIAMGGSWCP